MTFLDTGIMVGAVLKSHPEHAACLASLEDSLRPFTNAHAMAETFATLTGFYKVPTDAATELTLSLRDSVVVEALALADYETAIREARSRGVMGGSARRRSKRRRWRSPGALPTTSSAWPPTTIPASAVTA